MELTQKEIKFLSILNETRLSDKKMLGRYSEEVKKVFQFSNSELDAAVKKLVKMELISVIDVGGNEKVYFHTEKVSKDILEKELVAIRH